MMIIFAGFAASRVWAADLASEKDYLQEFPVVLSASRLSQPLSEAPNAMTVIDRAMIGASGFRNIADVFRLVPGMTVNYKDGHFPIVAYHGSVDRYSRQMQVLVDGRSVYLPPFSSVSWEDIPLHIDDIERVEVVRGPAAASYGANSFQGVINIITRDASGADGASVSVAKGNGGIADVSAGLGQTGDKLDYRATLAYRADNGFDTSALNDGNVTRQANLRAGFHPNSSDSFDFQAGFSRSAREEGIAGRATDPFADAKASSNFQQVTWLRALPQFDEFKLNYYRISQSFRDYSDLRNSDVTAHRQELELQHTAHLGSSNRLVWGGGVRTDSVEAPAGFKSALSFHQSRLFAHDEWRMSGSAVLNAGAMYENDGMGHRNTSPRVSLNYHLTPQHTLRAGTSVAYRNPAVMEEKADIPGQYLALGGVRPEKIHSKEIGYLGEFDPIGVTVDARGYYDRVSDIIYVDPSPLGPPPLSSDGKPYSLSNLLSATYRGYEGTIKYSWEKGSHLTLNYSRQYVASSVSGTLREPLFLATTPTNLRDIAASYSSLVPRNSGSILLAQQVGEDIQLSAACYLRDSYQYLNTSSTVSKMRRVDMKVTKAFGKPVARGGGEVSLTVQNAFQDSYTEYSAVPQTHNKIIFKRRAILAASKGF